MNLGKAAVRGSMTTCTSMWSPGGGASPILSASSVTSRHPEDVEATAAQLRPYFVKFQQGLLMKVLYTIIVALLVMFIITFSLETPLPSN
jgi:hypothetical protein